MVQRKAPNKLGIQADSKDHVKSDKWSLALKPSSQHQDIQDKGGTELKKELKKSRSIKLLDLENVDLPPTRRAKSRYGKPPTSASTAAATPQRQSMINKRDPSPNYMKPTNSSDARKESSQVNPHGYRASCPRKSPSPSPSARNSSRMSLSPCPNGRNSNRESLSPSPSGRNSQGTSLNSSSRGRNSYRKSPSPSPSGRNFHCSSPSPCPSVRNSNCMGTSPNPSRRISVQNSTCPSPDGRSFNSPSLSPSLRGRYTNTKPCSAADHKPIRTSKTLNLKPVRTLTKTPSFKGRAELKKQIKKSRSIKLLDLQTLESSPVEHANSGFGESTGNVSSAAVTPGDQYHMKTPDLLPNYMKPTSSSYARKEQSQVSTQGSQTSPSKSPNESNLIHRKSSSASGHKPARTLTKTSSLKPLRTLTKTSSLKLRRRSMKNRPDIDPCSSMTAGGATCSSTLKGSKFPTFLALSPGATESEGTSAMKVCPYNYCSLNGHRHAPLPLLKHFLSARRRLLKTQKSLRMKNLPLKKNPPGKRKRDIDIERVAFNDDPKAQAEDLAASVISPMIKEDGKDFFIEIYAKVGEDTATSIGRSIQDGNDESTTDCAAISNILVGITSPIIYGTERETEDDAGKVLESRPNELSYSDISLEENINQKSNLVSEVDIPTFQQDQIIQITYTDYQSCLIIEETGMECCNGKELEGESTAGPEQEESSLEATDMDWEEGTSAAPPSNESDLMTVHLPEFRSPPLQEELVFKTDETVNKNSEEFPVEGLVQQQVQTENAESFTVVYGDDDSETDVEDQSSWKAGPINVGEERSDISDLSYHNLFSSTEVACKDPAKITEEVDGVPKPDEAFNSKVYSASVENPSDDITASSDERAEEAPESENFLQEHQLLGENELIPITDVRDGALVNEQQSSLTFSNNLLGVDVGGEAEGEEQAQEAVELDGNGEKSSHVENNIGEEEIMPVEDIMETDATEKINSEDNIKSSKKDEKIVNRGKDTYQQLPMTSVNLKRTIRCRRPIEEQEELRKFNPREPQFLDIEPEPEAERVDLRHQTMDGRKNAEEWMLDHALQQAVTRLAPARKRRVSLLVEAFEAVIPPPKCETHLPNTSAAFAHARPIQACN